MSTLLLIEHDHSRIQEIRELLSDHFNVDVAFTGWEGLAAAMMYKPNLVLFNLNAHVMDGVEAVRLVRTEPELKDLPVLGFTEPSVDIIEKEALNRGCTRILSYPFDSGLPALLKEYLPESS